MARWCPPPFFLLSRGVYALTCLAGQCTPPGLRAETQTRLGPLGGGAEVPTGPTARAEGRGPRPALSVALRVLEELGWGPKVEPAAREALTGTAGRAADAGGQGGGQCGQRGAPGGWLRLPPGGSTRRWCGASRGGREFQHVHVAASWRTEGGDVSGEAWAPLGGTGSVLPSQRAGRGPGQGTQRVRARECWAVPLLSTGSLRFPARGGNRVDA